MKQKKTIQIPHPQGAVKFTIRKGSRIGLHTFCPKTKVMGKAPFLAVVWPEEAPRPLYLWGAELVTSEGAKAIILGVLTPIQVRN